MSGWIVSGAVAFSALVACGCRTQTESGFPRTLARVGDAELTIEEARYHIDTTRGGVDAQLKSYVSSWVNSELVYLEAKRLGIDRSETFADRLADVQREVADQILLDRAVYNDSDAVSDEALQAYYAAHTSEFFIQNDMVKLNVATLYSRERASAFAAQISQGARWGVAIADLQKDSTSVPSILSSTAGGYFTARTLFPSELWKVAQALNTNEVSFPIKTHSGFMVVQLLASLKQGAHAPLDLARDEVRQRLLLEHRRQRYAELLGTLRKRYAVQLFMDSHNTPDSTQTHE